MAKWPAPGAVKTRLAGALTVEQRSALYTAFLLDKVDQVLAIDGGAPVVAFTPATARAEFARLLGRGVSLIAQSGADLGERLDGVVSSLLGRGAPGVLVIDSDTPDLPSASLVEGLEALARVDLVLGPAVDGGYYAIGLRRACPALFQGIAWSTDRVLAQTLTAATQAGLSTHELPAWYDIDTPDDLDRLAQQLAAASRRGGPARTASLLRRLGL
jgi:hypothetical protein